MLFNSYTFLGFYACVFLAYLAVNRSLRLQNALLLLASYVFYAAWDYRFLGLILLSTAVDFVAGTRIERSEHHSTRRSWLVASLVVNLGMLAIFKYLGFAIDSFCELTRLAGVPMSNLVGQIVLPVGISFYTFQTLSYTIDVYRRRVPACHDPLAFAVYVAFFPQLVAGPIERATHFLPQVRRTRLIRRSDLAIGLQFVVLGYFYKVALADSIAPIVDQFYASPQRFGGSIAWIANVGFAVQIYGDFAGYSLIARGVSRWMGFRLMSNFRQPYLATSPRDFWTRWHRSLSLWLRRYLYFELGGSRNGFAKTCRNLMITMLLGGLWHGAAWNFVLWGGFHGTLLVAQHWWIARRPTHLQPQSSHPLLVACQIAATFLVMLIGWTLFRCETIFQVGIVLGQMFATPLWDERCWSFLLPVVTSFAIMQCIDLVHERQRSELILVRAPVWVRWTVYAACILSVVSLGFRPISFIYFQF